MTTSFDPQQIAAEAPLEGVIVTAAAATRPTGGIYALPVVGPRAAAVRVFFDDMRPVEDDSIGVVAGKQIVRYGAVVGGAVIGGAAMMVVAL